MGTPRLSMVTLLVDDVAAAVDFYRAALDWTGARVFGDEIAFVQMNGFVLGLWRRDGWATEGLDVDAPAFSHVSINYASPEEADAAASQWVKSGGAIARPLAETYWGGYAGYGRDPWGNLVEFAVNDEFEVTPEGFTRLKG